LRSIDIALEKSFFIDKGVDMLVGIDEVGRGPLAGPLLLCACVVSSVQVLETLPAGIADSKSLSAKVREGIFAQLHELAGEASTDLYFLESWQSAPVISQFGLGAAIKLALVDLTAQLSVLQSAKQSTAGLTTTPSSMQVLLDGGLKLPDKTITQQTVIKGDQKFRSIAAASIWAKVKRDAYMQQVAKTYPDYGFERHVGYGTKKHLEAIAAKGITPEHRTNFAPIARQTSYN
jgi:ribonuclease HII